MNRHSKLTCICGMGFLALLSCGSMAAAQEEAFVSYERFGAVGDGKADDQAAIAKAHEYANEKGLPVKVADDKTYYIGGGKNLIVIKTDTDFGKAHFMLGATMNTPTPRLSTWRSSMMKCALPKSVSVLMMIGFLPPPI